MPAKSAIFYRMGDARPICLHGLKTRDLLERRGFTAEDNLLTTREEVDAFRREHGVATTLEGFIEGTRIGGFDDLRFNLVTLPVTHPHQLPPGFRHFRRRRAMGARRSWATLGVMLSAAAIQWFIALRYASWRKAVYIDKRDIKCAWSAATAMSRSASCH